LREIKNFIHDIQQLLFHYTGDNNAITPKYTHTYFEGDCILCISLNRTVIYTNAMNRAQFKAICNVRKRG
jgi:hypothetical protein